TMCAWYHVVDTWAVNQNTVPNAKKTVVPRRTAGPTGSRPIAHQHRPTSTAARTVKIAWSFVAGPQSATNGTRSTAGSGGNGSNPRATPSVIATGRTSWNQALPGRLPDAATG